jgi:hypothetical protein
MACMRLFGLQVWALSIIAMLAVVLPSSAKAQRPGSAAALAAEEKEKCTRNLNVIYDAIQAYQFDHKDLPNWLSDLVPDYISDGNVLICPVCRRTGKTEVAPLADPKLACSYVYEFCPVTLSTAQTGEPTHTRREWKRRQMGLVGSVVPIVRCRNHNPVLNLGFNGNVYESPSQWELLYTNRVRTAELSWQAIFGGEPVEEPTPTPTTSAPAKENAQHEGETHPIDLTGYYTSDLSEPWQGKPGDDLASLSKGLQTFDGIDFDVRGVIQLKGNSGALAKFPNEVKKIPVRHLCKHLYFLHAASLSGPAIEGEQIGSYFVHLSHNQLTLEIPIFYGRSVRSWHEEKNERKADAELKVAWTGENTASNRNSQKIRLFVTAWNLAPGIEIDSLDFTSNERTAAPFLVAISYD